MKRVKILISGSGTLDQVATRLIELGRQLQIANTYDTEIPSLEIPVEDGCLNSLISKDD